MKVWMLILFMWSVPTVEDGGSYHTYRTTYETQVACEADLRTVLKTGTPHMTAVCAPQVVTLDKDCKNVIGWMKDCPND